MKILALDLATKTGWALWDGARIESGVQDFSPQRGESPGMRYHYFNRWLTDMAVRFDGLVRHPRLDLIFCEQNFRRGGHASEVAAGFSTRVHECCATTNPRTEYGQLNVMTLKKWATGSGKADKQAMIAVANKFYRQAPMRPITDNNESDAILLLGYALEKFGGENPCNARPAAAEGIGSLEKSPVGK